MVCNTCGKQMVQAVVQGHSVGMGTMKAEKYITAEVKVCRPCNIYAREYYEAEIITPDQLASILKEWKIGGEFAKLKTPEF